MFAKNLTGKVLSFEFYPKAVYFECKFWISPGAIIGDGDRKRAPLLVLGLAQGRGRRLLKFSYLDHPTKSDVTSGLNWAAQLVSQSEKMAFRFAKIFSYLQPIRLVSFQTVRGKMLQAHSFDFETKTFGKRQHFTIVLKENN